MRLEAACQLSPPRPSPLPPQIAVEEESRVCKELLEILSRNRMLSLPELDASFCKLLAAGKNLQGPSELIMHLMKTCMLRVDQVWG